MNYIQQIRAFDDFRLYKSKLSSGQVALWYALMSINNKTSWQTWFTAANATLESLSGLSRSGIAKDRNILKQLGLIDFKSNGRQATSYHVCVLYTSDSVQGSTQDSTQGSTHNSTQHSAHNSGTLTKLNETKLNKEEEDARATVFDLWQKLWGFPNAIAQQDLDEWITTMSPELIHYAIEIAGKNNVTARSADKYIGAVVDGWQKRQVKTLEQAKQANAEHEHRLSNAKGGYSRNSRKNVKETLPDWAKPDYQAPKKEISADEQAQAKAETEAALEKLKALRQKVE